MELMQRLRLLCDVVSGSDISAGHSRGADTLPNPWQTSDVRQRIGAAEDIFRRRVIGQGPAIGKIVDVLKRAALGLSGVLRGVAADRRSRAVFLFAGPTGTGRLEAAACIADVVFGDLSAYVKFGMGEFSDESQIDRLTGAPPGFAGLESGGELTNALREQPYRVVVFDEIEKAHPRFYDKLLQILEDGRLTDGSGITVDFSQSIIIAVTNLGVSYYVTVI
jgi:ATP-dependent Clp protease ATP-binding subunit ClpB